MSQQQPRRPQDEQEEVKYGDVFPVYGDLADKAVRLQDAALMQSAENMVLGKTQKGGPAAVMQSSGTCNERAGLVGHTDITDVAQNQGVSVAATHVPGGRIVIESVAGQYWEAQKATKTEIIEDPDSNPGRDLSIAN